MFCSKCGAQIADESKFCNRCGCDLVGEKSVPTENTEIFEEKEEGTRVGEFAPTQIAERRMGDKFTDTIASKLGGKDVKTVRVSMEDILQLIKIHFVDNITTKKEKEKLVKACGGGSFLLASGASLESADGNWRIHSYNVTTTARSRINILHPTDSSYVMVKDKQNGVVYTYYAFSLKKVKKAVQEMLQADNERIDVSLGAETRNMINQVPTTFGQQPGKVTPASEEVGDKSEARKSIGFCAKCGSPIEYGCQFCATCGTAVPQSMIDKAEAVKCEEEARKIAEEKERLEKTQREMMERQPDINVENMVESSFPKSNGGGTMFCWKCGTKLDTDALFCASCGTKVE